MDNGISLSSCISGLACFSQKIQTSEYNIAKSEIETEESMSDNIGSKWPTKAKNLTCTRGQKLWDLILLPIAMAQVSLKKYFISPPPVVTAKDEKDEMQCQSLVSRRPTRHCK